MVAKTQAAPHPIDFVMRPYEKTPAGRLTSPHSLMGLSSAQQIAAWRGVYLEPIYDRQPEDGEVDRLLRTETNRRFVVVVEVRGGIVTRVFGWRAVVQGC